MTMRKSTSTIWMILMFALSSPRALPQAPPLVSQLKQAYRLSKMTPSLDGQPNIMYGAAFTVRQPGMMGVPWTNLGVAVASFENGALKQPGWADRAFATEPLWFQPGDRVFAEKFDVDMKHDKITFTLVTEDYRYKAGLHFKFSKGYLATARAEQLFGVIAQVIAFEGAGDNAPQRPSPPAPIPASAQAQPPAPAPSAPMPPAPAQPSPAAPGASVAPLMLNGRPVGYGPVGAVLLPPDQQPPSSDGRAWVPVIRNGQTVAYAPPGSVIWPDAGTPAGPPPAPAPAPPAASDGPQTIHLGQTAEEVQAILGAPEKIANVGSKVIFVYKDLKVTLTDGKVTDVQ